MTKITPEEDLAEAERLYQRAKVTLNDAIEVLETVREQVRGGNPSAVSTMTITMQELLRAAVNANKMEGNLVEARKTAEGIVYDFALDLEEARCEIVSRLDNIAEARRT